MNKYKLLLSLTVPVASLFEFSNKSALRTYSRLSGVLLQQLRVSHSNIFDETEQNIRFSNDINVLRVRKLKVSSIDDVDDYGRVYQEDDARKPFFYFQPMNTIRV